MWHYEKWYFIAEKIKHSACHVVMAAVICSALLSESLQRRVHLDLISLLHVLHRVRRG